MPDQGRPCRTTSRGFLRQRSAPDVDNVIPIALDGDWFEDDAGVFRTVPPDGVWRANAWKKTGKFITESLGVKNLRDYFHQAREVEVLTTTTFSAKNVRSTGSPAPGDHPTP